MTILHQSLLHRPHQVTPTASVHRQQRPQDYKPTVSDEALEADAAETVQVGHAGGVDITLGRLVVTADAGAAGVAIARETLRRRNRTAGRWLSSGEKKTVSCGW